MNLEAKNYGDIAFNQILNGNCKQLDAWIDQTEEPADDGDVSFTIFKITRKGSWAVFKKDLLPHFNMTDLSFVTYCKGVGTDKSDTYVIVDHEKFFLQNVDQVRRLGSEGTS